MTSSYADAAAFRNAAATGQLGVDPDRAQAVLNKIRAGKDHVAALLNAGGWLAQQPKLGANPVGHAMAAKMSDRAQGGDQSYTSALQNLHTQYAQAEEAIVAAMRHYDQFENDAATSFQPLV